MKKRSKRYKEILKTAVKEKKIAAKELIDFVKYTIQKDLEKTAAIEIELLEAFKLQRLSVSDIEGSLAAGAA